MNKSDDLSISDVRKQVCCNLCQELVDCCDVEVVDQIPDKNQDNNDDDTSNDYDQEKLSDVGNFEENQTILCVLTKSLWVQAIKMI